MKNKTLIKKYLAPIILFFLIIIIWQVSTSLFHIPEYFLPSPANIISVTMEKADYLFFHTKVTMVEIILGFIAGVTFAIICSIGFFYSKILEKALYPILIMFNVVPKLALAPLFIIWFGYGLLPKIVISALVSFFPVLVSTITGLKSVNPEIIDLMDTISATKTQILRKIRFPNALPHIFSGLKVSITLSVIGAIIGEFVGANKGLGYVIMISNIQLKTSLMFSALTIISIIGILLFWITTLFEKKILFWHETK